jgi:FixJ family two-component response regulator
LKAASERVPICVFLDVVMPKRSGLEILKELRARRYVTPIFLVSGRDDLPTALEAMKGGALDYITKPFDPQMPPLYVRNAIEAWSHHVEERRNLEFPTDNNREWFHLNKSEREIVALARLMEHLKQD